MKSIQNRLERLEAKQAGQSGSVRIFLVGPGQSREDFGEVPPSSIIVYHNVPEPLPLPEEFRRSTDEH